MIPPHVLDDLDALSGRARSYLQRVANRVEVPPPGALRVRLDGQAPEAVVHRMAEFQSRWGGLVLPPLRRQDEGLRVFAVSGPWFRPSRGWVFDAGHAAPGPAGGLDAVAGYELDEAGELGMEFSELGWVAFHGSVEGWVEAVALTESVRRAVAGGELAEAGLLHGESGWVRRVLDEVLPGLRPLPEVRGRADDWLSDGDPGSVVLVDARGGAERALRGRAYTRARVYAPPERAAGIRDSFGSRAE
ncbi:hypothetical protein JOF53_006074 [Crossiella equi]|uniref:Uncharacterized protein n=1 Tax=Crossiella equi TaxID=130796 RepID=A0ABS5AKU9_9PSEU|nr:hypothetical protein [Crossiella equi]MBP2477202.1 hypothetical protein [Crossiella equi]